MIILPNAKINIGLNIIGKRDDGFHNIETVIVPITLKDILEITPSNFTKSSFSQSGIAINCNKDYNLVMIAYDLLKEKYKLPNVNIHLHKLIPIGAGLGGGSSDASFTLKLLNKIFELNIDENTLISLSKEIGSDCPFFIKNCASFASGRGEILFKQDLNLANYHILIVKPNVSVNTAWAYSNVKNYRSFELHKQILNPVDQWQSIIINDFEEIIFNKYPELKSIKHELINKGAIYASMTGSGSAIFGIFNEIPNINFKNCWQWKGKFGL